MSDNNSGICSVSVSESASNSDNDRVTITLVNPTAAQLQSALVGGLQRAEGKATARTLSLQDFPLSLLEARQPVARWVIGGRVFSSRGHSARATHARIYGVMLPAPATPLATPAIPDGHPHQDQGQHQDYRVDIVLERAWARNSSGAMNGVISTYEDEPEPEQQGTFRRLDEATVALLRFGALDPAALDSEWETLRSRGASGYYECCGSYQRLCLHTDYAFQVTRFTTLKGKVSPAEAQRFAWSAGRLVPSGIAVRERDHTGALYWEHGSTLEECHAETARKKLVAAYQLRAAKLEETMAAKLDRGSRLLARIGSNLTATLEDARSVGYCMPGIEAWARARGIDTEGAVDLPSLLADSDDRARRVALLVARRALKERILA